MTALAILNELRSRGVQVVRDGANLRLRPAGALTPELLEVLREHKAEVLPLVPLAASATVLSVSDERDDEARWPHRIVIDEHRPPAGPVRLNPWTTVVDTARAIEADLGSLAVSVRAYSLACGDPGRQGEAEEVADRIEELIERLAACGCRVRVVGLQ